MYVCVYTVAAVYLQRETASGIQYYYTPAPLSESY